MSGKSTLTITDNRTGKTYELPVENGTIRALDLRKIKADEHDFGLMTYDPAFTNTASCKSAITFIDGDKGILEYRGYPIEELAEKSTFLEVAWLLLKGELPTAAELKDFTHHVSIHTYLHENLKKLMEGFRHDAHPMGMLLSTVGALSTFYPDAKQIFDAKSRNHHVIRLIAKMPTIAAFVYRHSIGFPYVYPDNELSYTGNFLSMMKKMAEPRYVPNPVLERALDVLFILHADHEQNCSTNAMRSVGSAQTDPYSSVAAATAALYGPLHGGANEAVLRMLHELGDIKNVPAFVKDVKEGHGEKRLMGFGHRVYKNYDPRATVIKKLAEQVFEVTGKNPPPRDRARARTHRAAGRLLRQEEALSERGLLLRPDLRGDGLPLRFLHGALRDPAHGRLARPVAGAAHRQRSEDRAAAADLHGLPAPELRPDREARAHQVVKGLFTRFALK